MRGVDVWCGFPCWPGLCQHNPANPLTRQSCLPKSFSVVACKSLLPFAPFIIGGGGGGGLLKSRRLTTLVLVSLL